MTGIKGKSGGFRKNAKRPLIYGEATVRIYISVPKSKEDYFKKLLAKELKKLVVIATKMQK
jgi:hypothetical protein